MNTKMGGVRPQQNEDCMHTLVASYYAYYVKIAESVGFCFVNARCLN